MTKRSVSSRSVAIVVAVLVCLAAFGSSAAFAKRLKIWPDQIAAGPNCSAPRPDSFHGYYAGEDKQCNGSAEVLLPVGAVIKRVLYLHRGRHSTAYTAATFHSAKFGQHDYYWDSKDSLDASGEVVKLLIWEGSHIVERGHRYWFSVGSDNFYSHIMGFIVVYENP